jgi:hypothetical protein
MTLASTLAGATFTAEGPLDYDDAITDGITGFELSLASGAQAVIVYDHEGWSGSVLGGVLIIGPGNPDAGAVYCIGGGTASDTADSHGFTLAGLSRLGTCAGAPAVDGAIEAAFVF